MISVIIPTYNKNILLQNLKKNVPYLEDYEIIIVNDNPETSIKKEIKLFKNTRLIENKKNLGFGVSINNGVARATNPYIMLLNDDVVLMNNDFKKALNYFKKDRNLFAVSFAQIEKNKKIVGKNKTFWKRGLFFHQKADDLTFGDTGWAEGGSCLIDKKKFQELCGFNTVYSPFYWEDIDLSYRAKKVGYRILFDPNVIVEHHHESTIGKYYSIEFIKTIAFRNQFLFIWKNIRGKRIISHFLFLPINIVYYSYKNGFAFIKGLFKALNIIIHE